MWRARLVLVMIAGAGALSGVAGCGPDLPERLWRSEHVRYFSRDSDTSVCPAILDELEEHGAVIAHALMIPQPIVTYRKFDGLSDFDDHAGCGALAGACAQNAEVRSPVDFDRHELIHAYLSPYGRPPWLLLEGAAVALACERYPRPTGSWRDAFNAPHPSVEHYKAGGWLVGYILRMESGRQFPWLYNRLSASASADDFARAFEDIYEMQLDDVWNAAISVPQAPMRCPWECGRPPFDLDGVARTLQPACSGGTLQLSVDLPAGGVTRWRIEGEGRFSLRSCNGNDEPSGAVSGADGTGALVAPLVKGQYFIEAAIEEGGTPALAGSVDSIGEAASFTCASAPALPDDVASLSQLAIFYPSSTASRFTGFATTTDRIGRMTVRSDDPTASVALCDSCDPQTCSSIAGGAGDAAITGTIAPDTVVNAAPGPALTAHVSWPAR